MGLLPGVRAEDARLRFLLPDTRHGAGRGEAGKHTRSDHIRPLGRLDEKTV